MHDGMGWWMVWGSIFWVLLFVGIAALVAWVTAGGQRNAQPPRDSALEVLRERYARGEIDREEFERMRKDLGG
ncbi:MAG: SHOCT domain-containing protein [Tepidiformaceae bacterium]